MKTLKRFSTKIIDDVFTDEISIFKPKFEVNYGAYVESTFAVDVAQRCPRLFYVHAVSSLASHHPAQPPSDRHTEYNDRPADDMLCRHRCDLVQP